jgi:acetyl-CoA synthetase
MPKMVQHDFTYPLGHILTAKYWQNVQEDGLHLTVADTGWAKAVWGKIYGQWIAGCAVFVYDYERFEPRKLLDVLVKYGITSFCAPPTIYRFLIKEDLSKYRFNKLTYCAIAGEPLNPEVYAQFLKATGIRLMEGYGQTESTVAIGTFPWLEPKPGSMGKPSPRYDIDLLNDDGKACDVGEEGQIVVRTGKGMPVGMFGGYYRDAELTTAVWHDDIYYTGDMAWRDEDGYYWFVGRADDLIKSSGYRIGPFEVESALIEHPAVIECAITPVPDPLRGQVVKASIVLAKGYIAGEELAHELQAHVKKVTAPYKYPRIIEFVDELPKTISGKIRRVAIREKDEK